MPYSTHYESVFKATLLNAEKFPGPTLAKLHFAQWQEIMLK